MKIKEKVTFAKKVIEQAKKELNKEREEKYKARAKELLEDIQEAKRTVNLLEKQMNNFVREIDLDN
jgi:hypothetical protein